MSYYVYILLCTNNSYYTGYTTDIKRRYQEHVDGTVKCKYTRSFPPLNIAACWAVEADISLVLRIERAIKKLSKQRKQFLTEDPKGLANLLAELEFEPSLVAMIRLETVELIS